MTVTTMSTHGGSPRSASCRDGVSLVDRGVNTPWSVQGVLPDEMPTDVVDEALHWCSAQAAGRGFGLVARRDHTRSLLERQMLVSKVSGVYATTDTPPTLTLDERLVIDTSPSHGDVIEAYGDWMGDVSLARRLVWAQDMASPDRRFLTALWNGRLAGSALVWFADGTAYLSGIGVTPGLRGRGIGSALTAAAWRTASTSRRADIVWMRATPQGAALYSSMGFARVDEHVTLQPAAPQGPGEGPL